MPHFQIAVMTHFFVATHRWLVSRSSARVIMRHLILETVEVLLKLPIFASEFFIVSAIYALLVAKVVRVARLTTKSSRNYLWFASASKRLSKYPSSASRLISCASITRSTPGCVGAVFCITLCAALNWYLPPAAFFLIVAFLAAVR